MSLSFPSFVALAVTLAPLHAHAPPTPIPVPPLHVEGSRLVDANRATVLLRGVSMPGLEVASPSAADLAAQAAMTSHTFRVIQQRWNMNAVRLPISPSLWKQNGAAYLDRIAAAVSAANAEGLIAILAAYEDARSGAPSATGLPGSDLPAFWSACAQRFQSMPGLIFALYNEPSSRNIPGATPGSHRDRDWQVWLNGGTLAGGQASAGMQSLADAIRAAGASQVIAAPAFQDSLEFQGFTAASAIRDPNVIYETHPSYDHDLTDEARDANFGFMIPTYAVYAGSWGMPFGRDSDACRAVPLGVAQATDLLFQTVAYFDRRAISWTVADFAPGSLIQNLNDEPATEMTGRWTCDQASDPSAGIGQFILLFMTGDANGFGSLDPSLIASAAGGFGGEPVVPGEILSIFGQLVGPPDPVGARLDATGRLATSLGDVQVYFDGIPAPILLAGGFQVNVQVPYELAGRVATRMQLIYRGVESNLLSVPVVSAAPAIFTAIGTTQAAALNQDGTINSAANPAVRGSVVSLFATGCPQTEPPGVTGEPAQVPLPQLVTPAKVTIGGRPAEILYSGAAPGFVGTMQFNVRLPLDSPVQGSADRAAVSLVVENQASHSGTTLWIK